MRAPCTLTEAVVIAGLCLFAIGSARGSAATHIARMHQEKSACTRMQGNTRMEGNVVPLCGNRGFTSIRGTNPGH
jgi:hypothetical protein